MGLDMSFHKSPDSGGELAYWRKHWDLHALVVEGFGDRVEDTQEEDIPMDIDDIRRLIEMAEREELDDLEKLGDVLRHLEAHPGLKVFYRASW